MKIEVLATPGCQNCAKAERMMDEMKVKYRVIDITKNPGILKKYPIMSTPGIVINGKLAFTGVPSKEKLKEKLGLK